MSLTLSNYHMENSVNTHTYRLIHVQYRTVYYMKVESKIMVSGGQWGMERELINESCYIRKD